MTSILILVTVVIRVSVISVIPLYAISDNRRDAARFREACDFEIIQRQGLYGGTSESKEQANEQSKGFVSFTRARCGGQIP